MTSKGVIFGVLFGFVLSRIGATDYDAIAGMFKLTDLHLMGVIGGAVALSALGFWLIRRSAAQSSNGEPIVLTQKPMTRWLVPGSLMFGVGWALSGTCPGTALAQLGEGRWMALATIAGILLGSYLVDSRLAAAKVRETRPGQDPLEASLAAE
jgi:uncharacterized membrane protein YedE/YeeE